MTATTSHHPIAEFHRASRMLREQTTFAHRQAATCARQAHQATMSIASLDMELAFRQLRELVAMVTEPTDAQRAAPDNVVALNAARREALLLAAE